MTADAFFRRYSLLERTGLRVSPIALGTLTFGAGGWHADEDTARSVFRRYVEAGGNFVDSAVNYAGGRSEQLLGGIHEGDRHPGPACRRDQVQRRHTPWRP